MATATTERPDHEGILIPQIEQFVYELIQSEYAPTRLDNKEIKKLLVCPVVKASLTVITLLGLSYFGDYTNENEEIQTFIRSNLKNMKGSWITVLAQLFSAIWAGCSVGEWGITQNGKTWTLDQIIMMPPGKYTFLGTLGGIDAVRYYGAPKNIDVPYEQILHIINGQQFSFNDPAGFSELDSAIAAVKAWKIIMSEMVIAGSRQATPLTVGYYDPEAEAIPQFDENDEPRLNLQGEQVTKSPQDQMSDELSEVENKTVVVTSNRNKIEALSNQAGPSFFTESLRILHKIIFMSFLFPETGLEALGSGDSNLNKGHMKLLHENIEQIANQIKEKVIEDLICKLIVWNFGEQDDYGSFPAPPETEQNRIELFNAIVSAINAQVFPLDDLNIINKLYDLAGLPKVEEVPDVNRFGIGLSESDMNYWRWISGQSSNPAQV